MYKKRSQETEFRIQKGIEFLYSKPRLLIFEIYFNREMERYGDAKDY